MSAVAHRLGWLGTLPLLLLAGRTARAESVEEAAIDVLVRQALAAWHVPGAAVGIVRGSEVVYLKGQGVRRAGSAEPVTPDTLFPIASCTKAFTSAAMAVLVDEGKMAWDDPVRKYLPWFHLADPQADRLLTLRDLVTHRTGLRSHDMLWYRSEWSQEEILRRLGKLPLDKPFRSTFQYQSMMFTAAGHCVAAAAGMSWADFVRHRLLNPLGMSGVVFTTKDACSRADHAFPHRAGARGQPEVIDFYPIEVPDPAGAIHASARDLTRWLRFQMGDGRASGRRLVSAQNLGQTHTPQIDLPIEWADRQTFPGLKRMSYGMGWVLVDFEDYRVLLHTGVIDGFRSYLIVVPQRQIGIVILCNLHQTRMHTALGNALLDVLLDRPRQDWNAVIGEVVRREQAEAAGRQQERWARRVRGTHPSQDLAAYAGTYEHPAYGTATVSVGPAGLVWQWSSFRAVLEHFHYDTFTLPIDVMGRPQVIFKLDDAGVVEAMKVEGALGVEFRRRP